MRAPWLVVLVLGIAANAAAQPRRSGPGATDPRGAAPAGARRQTRMTTTSSLTNLHHHQSRLGCAVRALSRLARRARMLPGTRRLVIRAPAPAGETTAASRSGPRV